MSNGSVVAAAAEPAPPDSTPRVPGLAGKYMTFKLADEEYGLEILKVRELIRLLPVTRIPGTLPFIRGVVNLRGNVIPVVDLRLKFGLDGSAPTAQTVIIVVQYPLREHDLTMGVVVDEVVEVLDMKADQIAPPPNFGAGESNTGFILGVGKPERRVICLLDIGRILSGSESAALGGLREAAAT